MASRKQRLPKNERDINNSCSGKVVNCINVNIRKGPDFNSDISMTIPVNSELLIEDKLVNDFYKVVTASGCEGYCHKDYVQKY